MKDGKRRAAVGAMAFLALICMAYRIHAAGTEHERNSLKGLGELKIIVEEIEPQVEGWRVSTKRLRELLERKLQEAGIGVAAQDESLPGNPFLYLNINLLKVTDGEGMYAVHVTLALQQYVYLEHDHDIGTFGATWRRGTLLVMPVERLEEVEHFVARDVDEFIRDYRAAHEEE